MWKLFEVVTSAFNVASALRKLLNEIYHITGSSLHTELSTEQTPLKLHSSTWARPVSMKVMPSESSQRDLSYYGLFIAHGTRYKANI